MSDDLRRVDQGPLVMRDGELKVEITPAIYPSRPIKDPHPEKDTRVDLDTGEPIP